MRFIYPHTPDFPASIEVAPKDINKINPYQITAKHNEEQIICMFFVA